MRTVFTAALAAQWGCMKWCFELNTNVNVLTSARYLNSQKKELLSSLLIIWTATSSLIKFSQVSGQVIAQRQHFLFFQAKHLFCWYIRYSLRLFYFYLSKRKLCVAIGFFKSTLNPFLLWSASRFSPWPFIILHMLPPISQRYHISLWDGSQIYSSFDNWLTYNPVLQMLKTGSLKFVL